MNNTTSLIPFQGSVIEALQDARGVWVVLKRLCDNLGIDPEAQRKRLSDESQSPWATVSIMEAVAGDGKLGEVFCMDLDTLLMWLATIQPSKVQGPARRTLVLYQKECVRVLRQHFGAPAADVVQALQRDLAALRQDMALLLERSAPQQPKSLPETPLDILLERIRSGVLGQRFSARDVYLRHWKGLDQADFVTDACRALEALGHLRAEESRGKRGPTSTVYRVVTH